jgi:hypothetical protein
MNIPLKYTQLGLMNAIAKSRVQFKIAFPAIKCDFSHLTFPTAQNVTFILS